MSRVTRLEGGGGGGIPRQRMPRRETMDVRVKGMYRPILNVVSEN